MYNITVFPFLIKVSGPFRVLSGGGWRFFCCFVVIGERWEAIMYTYCGGNLWFVCSKKAHNNNQNTIWGYGNFVIVQEKNKGGIWCLFVCFYCPIVVLVHIQEFFVIVFVFMGGFKKAMISGWCEGSGGSPKWQRDGVGGGGGWRILSLIIPYLVDFFAIAVVHLFRFFSCLWRSFIFLLSHLFSLLNFYFQHIDWNG